MHATGKSDSVYPSVTLAVPPGFDLKLIPAGLRPEDNATILRYGVDLYQRSQALASKSGEAAVAALEREFIVKTAALQSDHEARENRAATEHRGVVAALQAELAAARSSAESLTAEIRRAAGRAADAANEAAAVRIEALSADLAETRTALAQCQAALADTVLDTARRTRLEAQNDLQPRIATLEAELAQARSANSSAVSLCITDLTARFDRVFSSQAASSVKGRLGEVALTALLERLFPDAEVEDCAATPGRGDATLTIIRAGRAVRLMVESKNVARVRADDLNKFARDCANRASDAHGALFAALTAETIPRLGPVSFGVEAGLPVLRLAAVAANPEALRLGVEALAFAALSRPDTPDSPNTDAKTDGWDDVREAVSVAFSVLSRQAARARALRDSAAAVLEAVAAFEGEASIAAAAIEALWRARPALKKTESFLTAAEPADPVAAASLRVRRFLDENRRDPSRDEVLRVCKVPEAILRRCGGARALVERAKKLVL